MDIQIIASQFYEHSLHMRGYSFQTIRRYKNAIHNFCAVTGVSQMDQITADNVRWFFFHGRTKRNWKPASFICFRHSLLVFFRWCKNQGYLCENFAEDIEVPKLEKRLPSRLSKQDALKLLEVVYNYPYDYKFLRYRNHAIFAVFIYAGLRKSELLNLKFTDVDLDNLSIFIRQGKGNKDRIVPMNFQLAQILKRYAEERRRLNKTTPFFFASLNRNLGFTNTGLKRLVERVREAGEISFTVHKLRHTFATLMLEGGCDIYSLSRMMGHSDIKTTTVYLSASVEHLRAQITKHPLDI